MSDILSRVGVMLAALAAFAAVPQSEARQIDLDDLTTRAGLAVLVGDEGTLANELAATGHWLVLVLCADEGARVKRMAATAKHAGAVTVAVWQTKPALPVADHMANLIVVSPEVVIAENEVRRALVPVRGKAIMTGQAFAKPMPENMDGWSHFFHGADGNKISRDATMRVPNGLRFIGGPRLQDSNGANGWRIDDGIAISEWNYTLETRERERWPIVVEARDAFNGTLLWQSVEWIARGNTTSKKTKPFILDDGRLLRIVDDGTDVAKLGAIDPLSGDTIRVYESSLNIRRGRHDGNPPQFTYRGGLVYQGDERKLVCFDAETDELKWTYEHNRGRALTRPIIAENLGLVIVSESIERMRHGRPTFDILGGRYPRVTTAALIAVDLKTGDLRWRCPVTEDVKDFARFEPEIANDKKGGSNKQGFHAIAYKDGRVFCLYACDANGGNPATVWAVDAKAGKPLWIAACGPVGHGTREMFDLFLLDDGSIFTYGHAWSRIDQKTGALLAYGNLGGNARCDTGASTANLIIGGFGNYIDIGSPVKPRWTKRDLARGQCGGWGTPAYGMVFYHGSGCGCFQPIRGNMALQHTDPPTPVDDDTRLTKGMAFDSPLLAAGAEAEWPAYLFNGRRQAWSPAEGPRKLAEKWKVKVAEPIAADATGVKQDWLNTGIYNGPATAPIVAHGMVFVADRDRHRVIALDAVSGEQRWVYRIGGRVLTPPTFDAGRLVFGGRDGYVYCLDAETGELAWRFFAAPEQRFLISYGQVESVWPVHGCLPVVDGTVVATAGYHGEADGGVFAWGLDLASGKIKWSRRLERPLRIWKQYQLKKTREGYEVYTVKDDAHELANANQSNGAYHPTRVRNIDLPIHDDTVVKVANQPLIAATGELSERDVIDALVVYGERYPFLDMEFEYRGGPHGTGALGVQLDGIAIGHSRGPGMRVAHNGKVALMIAQTPNNRVGPGLYLIDPAKFDSGKYKRIDSRQIREVAPIATSINGTGREADSFVVGGSVAYVASEGHLMRPWGREERPRPRWRKGELIPGYIEAFSVPGGETLRKLELDSAVINNGLAVAGGRLYAACEDGTLRCYE